MKSDLRAKGVITNKEGEILIAGLDIGSLFWL
jgi:hypothetical protein